MIIRIQGLSPFLNVYLHCLMYGSSEIREQSALGVGDLIQFTAADSLKPFVMQITGPLIRIVGEKFAWQIKAALLENLGYSNIVMLKNLCIKSA